MGAGLGKSVALITDGRFSGASRGFIIGHVSEIDHNHMPDVIVDVPILLYTPQVTPEAQIGGPIALLKDGDQIIIDAAARRLEWVADEQLIQARRQEWEISGKHPLREKRGVLYRYARDVAVSRIYRRILK